MKFARFATAVAAVALVAACHSRSEGEVREAGPAVSRDYQVGAFQRIAVSGPYKVEVHAAGAPSISATGGQNFLDQTEVVVEDGTLKIRTKKKNFSWTWHNEGDRVRIVINGAGALDGAAIAGSGGLSLDQAKAKAFKGEVAGSGDLALAGLDAETVDLAIAGSGSIRAAGKAGKTSYSIAGSGDLDANGLQSADTHVSIAGSGNVTAHATGTADVSIVGSGDVALAGGAKCNVSKQGSGNVTCS